MSLRAVAASARLFVTSVFRSLAEAVAIARQADSDAIAMGAAVGARVVTDPEEVERARRSARKLDALACNAAAVVRATGISSADVASNVAEFNKLGWSERITPPSAGHG